MMASSAMALASRTVARTITGETQLVHVLQQNLDTRLADGAVWLPHILALLDEHRAPHQAGELGNIDHADREANRLKPRPHRSDEANGEKQRGKCEKGVSSSS